MPALVLATVVASSLHAAGASAQHSGGRWAVTDLGTIGAKDTARAVSINDRGQIVGVSVAPNGQTRQAFLWEGGVLRPLPGRGSVDVEKINSRGEIIGKVAGPKLCCRAVLWRSGKLIYLGRDESWAADINDHGVVAGSTSHGINYFGRAFIWNGAIRFSGLLPSPQRYPLADVVAINGRGDVVGSAVTDSPSPQGRVTTSYGVRWSKGRIDPIAPLTRQSAVTGLNDSGQVVGWIATAAGRDAFLWQNGTIAYIRPNQASTFSTAVAINRRGDVVIEAQGPGGPVAFAWRGGHAVNLGMLGHAARPAAYTHATAINDAGQIIGTSNGRPFIWQDGHMTDLGSLPGESAAPVALNDNGQVVGYSTTPAGKTHALLWSRRGG